MQPSDPIDREDFLARFMAAQPSMRSYIQALVGHEADVDDVMQEVSLTLWREFARYDPSRPFIGWAFGVVRNHVARWRETRRTSRRRFSPEAEAALAIAYEELEDDLHERRAALGDCLERLGSQAREIIDLRYQRGLSLGDIAEMRGSSVNAINKTLGKIRRLLSDCAGQAGVAS